MSLRLARDILAEGAPIRAVSNIEQPEGSFLLIMIVVSPYAPSSAVVVQSSAEK